MKASAVSYARATSVSNALELLVAYGDRAKVLSGGQSLMPAMNLRLISPEFIVDIGELTELRGIGLGDDEPALLFRAADQREVTFMQRAHRRRQADAMSVEARPLDGVTQSSDCPGYFHCSGSPRSGWRRVFSSAGKAPLRTSAAYCSRAPLMRVPTSA